MVQRSGPLEGVDVSHWHQRRVFVTGATGLLGSALVEALVSRQADVTCLVRDGVPASRLNSEGWIARVNVVHGALEDFATLARAINEYEIDTVFHLAAQTIVGTANRSPLSTFEANIRGTWHLLEACRENRKLVQRVVVASSDKAYGVHERLPYTEDLPPLGRFPYDVSKSCTDLLAFSYFHSFQLPVAITRCGNLYGPGDLNFNRLIPGTIRSALAGTPPIIRSDGQFVRDYFFIRDAVAAYLALAERLPEARCVGQAFNFGTETPLSVLELVNTLLRVLQMPHLQPVVLNEASCEIPRQFLDCSKARAVLDWRPAFSLEQGLAETVRWYRMHLAPA